jgi:hypothetical protein
MEVDRPRVLRPGGQNLYEKNGIFYIAARFICEVCEKTVYFLCCALFAYLMQCACAVRPTLARMPPFVPVCCGLFSFVATLCGV